MDQPASIHIEYDPTGEDLDYHRQMIGKIVALIHYAQDRLGHNLSVLDVGCGRGELLRALREAKIQATGIDFDPYCAALSHRSAPVVQGDINHLDAIFKAASFDLVVASHVLEHLENPSHVVRAIHRITRRYLLVAVPNLSELASLKWRQGEPTLVNRGHKCGWDASHLKTFLLSSGFETIRWQSDRVYLQHRLRPIFGSIGLRSYLEDRLLPRRFPFQSHSLIVLAEALNASN